MTSRRFVGLMSGTSLDGVDAVLIDLRSRRPRILGHAHHPFDAGLRAALLALTVPGMDELARAATLGGSLSRLYALAVRDVIAASGVSRRTVRAIGCHGQTVRHHPERGFTIQIGDPARLAELTSLPVVCDFRSRDIAAGGQGAPLVPAFHAAAFGARGERRAVVNIGGIANVTLLDRRRPVGGFDTGPGNCLMDHWAARHLGTPCDRDGAWAATGRALPALLKRFLREPYFTAPPPKSTGRELFGETWLHRRLRAGAAPSDVQATLLELTASSIADALRPFAPARAIVCGGGSLNRALMLRLAALLAPIPVEPSGEHGFDARLVEATAFAWLAAQTCKGEPGNVPAATGAKGPRVLGAIYPA